MAPCRQLQAAANREAAAHPASTASHSARVTRSSIKVSQLAEHSESFIDLFARELLQALGAKPLYGERAHYTAVKHGATEYAGSELFLRSQVAKEAAREAVARTGGIDHFFEGQRRG